MLSSSTSQISSSSPSRNDFHRHQRRFIGPMPEQVLSNTESPSRRKKRARWLSGTSHSEQPASDEDETLKDVIKAHAYQFFIGHGGRDEDWSEDKELNAREEMLKRWRESDWRELHAHHRKTSGSKKWVGSSFEIGNFLGVNVLSNGLSASSSAVFQATQSRQSSTAAETFVTAPSNLIPPSIDQQSTSDRLVPYNGQEENLRVNSTSSFTPLLQPILNQSRSDIVSGPSTPIHLPTTMDDSRANGMVTTPSKNKGKGKQVHYSDNLDGQEPTPASPAVVLARTGSAVNETSAGVTEAAHMEETQPDTDNVIMRDRMLVRVSYTQSDAVDALFDENKNRTTHHLEYEDWAEFIVIWRKERLELYDDYSTPGKEWVLGHKHLAFIVPLNNQRTRLSLYSFVDLTFCFVCPPTAVNIDSTSRFKFHRAKPGRNIFVFKTKSRSRGEDWLWKLWRHLGGRFPSSIEIRCPVLDTRIKVDIPHSNTHQQPNYALFNRDNVVDLCQKSLKAVGEYEWLLQKAIDDGSRLELAWRIEMKLDWVWQFTDVEGKPRDWALLCGLSQKQGSKPAHLEVRLQQHHPIRLHLKDGTRLDEPLAVEGYLDRIRPNTQLKQPIYLATHDGYIFSMSPHRAFPPNPPGIPPDNMDHKSLRDAEVRRGCKQILEATGVSDLRNIVAIRRAFQLIHKHDDMNSNGIRTDDDAGLWEHVERADSDDEDKGGEEGIVAASDKGRHRMKRSFELVMTTGQVIRFEAYSCLVALEWVHRLRALVTYWRKRHEVDAKEEMDLAYLGTGKPRLTPFSHVHAPNEDTPPDAPPDPDAPLPDLSTIYNWCIINGCRSILKCGKLYVRKGLRGQYKKVQLVIVAGHLIQYRINATRSLHHRKIKTINLIDSYICSGFFAAQVLPEGQFNPDLPPVARRYQDGLETEDPEEDTLFMIWYRPHAVGAGDETGQSAAAQVHKSKGHKNAVISPLSAKSKVMIFRTRSKLERDSWCWALNTEIEKLVRASPERESKLREAGEIIRA